MPIALTIAIAVTILVPAFVGYWREPRRGVLALSGTLLGATLADFWAARWAGDIARNTGWEQPTLTFVISATLLITSALLIGYGSGVLLPPATHTPVPRRLLGALLGLLNGGMLAGYMLRYASASSPGFAEELLTIPLADLVRSALPLFFLGLAVVLALMIVGRRVLQFARRARPRRAPPTQPLSQPPAATPAASVQSSSADAGKSSAK